MVLAETWSVISRFYRIKQINVSNRKCFDGLLFVFLWGFYRKACNDNDILQRVSRNRNKSSYRLNRLSYHDLSYWVGDWVTEFICSNFTIFSFSDCMHALAGEYILKGLFAKHSTNHANQLTLSGINPWYQFIYHWPSNMSDISFWNNS